MPLLFSYGSNSPARLGERLSRVIEGRAAKLEDHEVVYAGWSENWRCPTASLRYHPGLSVFGYVADLMDSELAKLDRFEGAPDGAYKRAIVRVKVHGRRGWLSCRAWAYVSLAVVKEDMRPSPRYLDAMRGIHEKFFEGSKIKL